MDFSQQVAALETVDDCMHLIRFQEEEAVQLEREFRVALSRARASGADERKCRMAEMQLEDFMDERRRRVRLLHERAEEIKRNRASNAVDLDRGYCNYDTQSTAPHWRELVILPDDVRGPPHSG